MGKDPNAVRLLPGEIVSCKIEEGVGLFVGNNQWKNGVLYLTKFQIIFKLPTTQEIKAPLTCIQEVKRKVLTTEHTQLKLRFKDFRVFRFCFESKDSFEAAYSYIQRWINLESITNLFAFDFQSPYPEFLDGWVIYDIAIDYDRMGIPNADWRISSINAEYLLCPTYPQKLVVPAKITGQQLLAASKFRSNARIPVLVWKHPSKSVTITRCSQPLSGLTGSRCEEDEKLINLIAASSPLQKLVIIDARPKANAMANQMKGGGYENVICYENVELMWASIPNIHSMYDSWYKMCILINRHQTDEAHWLSNIESTQWFMHVHYILSAANKIVESIEADKSVLIHCSDGWDRTPSITSLAQILLDPFYRTIRGFILVIEKDWLKFGHRFAERCGHGEKKEKNWAENMQKNPESPIFLFFIDCVYQLLNQYPFAFEYNSSFLKAIVDACYSCQYGTFLGNSDKERNELQLKKKTVSFWTHVSANRVAYTSTVYQKSYGIIHPSSDIRDLVFWEDFYLKGLNFGFPSIKDTFNKATLTIINVRNARIRELEQELIKHRPDLFPSLQNVEKLIVKPILDEILRQTLAICASKAFEEELDRHKVLIRDTTLFQVQELPCRKKNRFTSADFNVTAARKLSNAPIICSAPMDIQFPGRQTKHVRMDIQAIEKRAFETSPKQTNRYLYQMTPLSDSFRPTQPPQWVRDEEAQLCYNKDCQTRFNSFKRKHHCRNCGNIFCAKCCFEKRVIEKYGYIKPVRVCNRCLVSLDTSSKMARSKSPPYL